MENSDSRPKNSNKILNVLSKMAETIEPVGAARLAAAIVLKNDIVAFGINRKKTHPFQKKYGKNAEAIYLHAEIDAIKNALKFISVDELAKASLYIVRMKKTGPNTKKFVPGLAKPCENGCQCAISAFGIKNVYYTNNDGEFECL